MTNNREETKIALKKHIVEYLNLLDIKAEDITDDEPLFGGRMALDSIDSLELIVLLDREFDVKIENPTEGRKILTSVNSIVDYIYKSKDLV
ncbi:MAG TPA: phosphopantetheine-binding protein [Chitinophagaceae bacterium]|nr:phosphopantetheine-binding protein [Chitinophagaceae bacterium]